MNKKIITLTVVGIIVVIVSVILALSFRCSIFGHTYEESIVDPTCTAEGYTTYRCKYCDNTYNDKTTPKIEHNYKKSTTATCLEEGVNTYVCEDCNDTYTENQAALGHSFKISHEESATCTKGGIKKYECVCGQTKQETIPALGHNWSTTKCLNCGETNPDVKDKVIVNSGGKKIWRIYIPNGTFTFKGTFNGSGNFIVKLMDANQDLEELICNEIGSYVVNKTVHVSPGLYYLETYCSQGSWNATWTGTYGN